MNPKPLQIKKAFTLIEVLIATMIFAVVMVMTTGVITQSVNYTTKTKALRDASEEAARISDAISRDLKTASGPFNVANLDINGNVTPLSQQSQYPNGIDLGTCSGFDPSLTGLQRGTSSYPSDVIIINTKDSIRIYAVNSFVNGANVLAKTYLKTDLQNMSPQRWYPATNTLVFSQSYFSTPICLPGSPCYGNLARVEMTRDPSSKISSLGLETSLGFSGYAACNNPSINVTATKIQSYVTFYVHIRTADFDSLPPTQRAEAYLYSMVTMRNYSP